MIGMQQDFLTVPTPDSIAFPISDKQVKKHGVLKHCDIVAFLHLGNHEFSDPAPRRIAACMKNAPFMVAALKSQGKNTVLGVERHTLGYYFLDTVGTFVDKNIDRMFLAQAASGNQRVGLMYFRIIVLRCHSGDSSLSVEGIAFPDK